MKEQWDNVQRSIQQTWNMISFDEIRQANGISELASLISRKAGEPRENVLHEIIHIVRTVDQHHSLVEDYMRDTRISGDDDNFLKDTGEKEPKLH